MTVNVGVIGVGIAVVVVRFLPLEALGVTLSDTPAFPAGAAIAHEVNVGSKALGAGDELVRVLPEPDEQVGRHAVAALRRAGAAGGQPRQFRALPA